MRHSDDMPKSDTGASTELLTATQVGTLINRSGRTVIRMAEAGEIPIAAKLPGINGAHLFRREDANTLAAKLANRASA